MLRTFYNGVSGVKTHSFGMDVWANNISNINNVGFTASIPEFKSIFYQSTISAGNNPTTDQVGLGATGMTTALSFYKQGPFMDTDNRLDMAIGGDGFFGVLDRTGETYYTRSGGFGVDKEGYLVDNEGRYVMGTQNALSGITPSKNAIDVFGRINDTPYLDAYTLSELSDLDLGDIGNQGKIRLPDFLYLPTKPTQNVSYKGNIDSTITKEEMILPIDDTTYLQNLDKPTRTLTIQGIVSANNTILTPKEGDTVTVTVTDANGRARSFLRNLDQNNEWNLSELLPDSFDLTQPLAITATLTTTQEKANVENFAAELFSTNGDKNTLTIKLTKQIPQTAESTTWDAVANVVKQDGTVISQANGTLTFDGLGRLSNSTLATINNDGTAVNLDFGSYVGAGYTGITSTSNPRTLTVMRDGSPEGIIKEYNTNHSGNILASFTNGKTISVGKVALYHFQNDQGLTKLGDNVYAQSANSGQAFFYKDKDGKTIYGSQIKNYVLEQSNVSLAQALTEIIAIQKGYDASAKSITTGDEMIQTAIQMKR